MTIYKPLTFVLFLLILVGQTEPAAASVLHPSPTDPAAAATRDSATTPELTSSTAPQPDLQAAGPGASLVESTTCPAFTTTTRLYLPWVARGAATASVAA